MNSKAYKLRLEEMEVLLAKFTQSGKLTKRDQLKLDKISDQVAEYEETNYAFKPESLCNSPLKIKT